MNIEATEEKKDAAVLLFSVLVISICALTYELLISTASSYFLGSSVLHFSVTIGLFMTFLGVGSYLSKFILEDLLDWFIKIEIALGLVGGVSAAILYISFSATEWYYPISVVLIASISCLVGLEIPLVARLLKDYQNLKDLVAHVFTFDYVGALFASLLFPLVLLPYCGLIRTAALMGIVNLLVAYGVSAHFRSTVNGSVKLRVLSLLGVSALILLLASSLRITALFESFLYEDEIVQAKQTQYQRLVVTRFKDDIRLFINGDLQFSSADEYRYHEPLVHLPMAAVGAREHILILGGGDGLAVREVLKYPDVKQVTVVDIDPEMTEMGRSFKLFTDLNGGVLSDPRVRIVNQDAWKFIENSGESFSVIIIDLPDPNDFSLGKLYSKEFYMLAKRRLAVDGILVTQSTSPYQSREPFWIINRTLREVFPEVRPYTVNVPSFGQWGFNLASQRELKLKAPTVPTRYLTAEVLPTLFVFDSDTEELPTEVNRLDNQALVTAYERSWEAVN